MAVAKAELQAAVDRARSHSRSWADIGALLGITRQAAFKRFGHPRDPHTGQHMERTTSTRSVIAMVESVFMALDAGDYDAIRSHMTAVTARTLTRDKVLDTWAAAVAEAGNLVACRDTTAQLGDGTVLHPDEMVLGMVIGYTILECEAGAWMGRLAVDDQYRIIGMLVVPMDHGSLPF